MNSKDNQKKPPVPQNLKPKVALPLMTPRNLVPATPMRFNSSTTSSNTSSTSTVNSSANRVVKGPQKSKDKSSVPLPPGYVDRAAQRRSGTSAAEPVEVFQFQIQKDEEKNVPIKDKLEFLDENAGKKEFPNCSNESVEKLMKLAFGVKETDHISTVSNEFRTNEAFLQFKSIEESKTQPFDPFNRPKKVFRASSSRKVESIEASDDFDVLEPVREALGRLKSANERNQKYLETLSIKDEPEQESQDIFPDAGIFDEKVALNSVLNPAVNNSKVKANDRLFKSSASKESKKEKDDSSGNVDIFEFIAQKPLEDNKESIEDDFSGGLFGFSNILPKLNRLQDETAKGDSGNNSNKLTGVYATILDDNDDINYDEPIRKTANIEDEDESLYPGYLENDLILGSDDEEGDQKGTNKRRKLGQKEDKEAAKVEKLVKSKFGVDLTK